MNFDFSLINNLCPIAYSQYEDRGKRSSHIHDGYEIGLYFNDKIHIENGITRENVTAPFLAVHRPYTVHNAFSISNQKHLRIILYFREELFWGIDENVFSLSRIFKDDLTLIKLSGYDAFRLDKLLSVMVSEENVSTQKYLLLALISEIQTLIPETEQLGKIGNGHYISNVVKYISENYCEKIDIGELASMNYVSVRKLNSDFKIHTKTTVHEMLLRVRLQKASKLLYDGSSVSNAAYDCGFVNVSHFIRVFKKYFGITPSKYKSVCDENMMF